MHPETVRRRAAGSVLALVGRSALARVIALAGMVLLARLLTPAQFGVWELIAFPTLLFTQISEAGLPEALARLSGEPDARDLGAAAAARLSLALALAALTWIVAPGWAALYGLSAEAVDAFRLLALMHPVAALGTAPGALLLRELQFGRMALAEVAAALANQVAAVSLAALGMGVGSLAAGALASAVVGTAALWLMRPGPLRLAWSWARALDLLRFGGPYTLQALVHLMREGVIASVGGARLPLAAVGYQRWAYNLARVPRVVAQAVHQVGLPAFARLQDQPPALGATATDALRLVATVTFPLLAATAALAPWGVPAVFGEAWAGASPALTLFALNMGADSVAAVLLPLLDATGRVWATLGLSAVWAALTWLAALALAGRVADEIALAWAFLLGTLAATAALALVSRRAARVAFGRALGVPLAASLAMGAGLRAVGPAVGANLPGLAALTAAALALYAAMVVIFVRRI